jgi:MFS family permease
MTTPEPQQVQPRSRENGAVPAAVIGDGAEALSVAASDAPPATPLRAPGPGRGRRPPLRDIFISFRSRDFRYLALSSLALGFGQWAQQVGLAWLVWEMTDSATQIGGVWAVQGGIGIAVGPVAGYLADRFHRRSVLVWTTAVSALQAGLLAALVLAGAIELWQLYALALAGGVLQTMSQPARQSFVYDVSTDETLVNAVAMNSIVQNFARIAAPPLTGAMIGFSGAGAPFVFLAVTKIIAVVITLQISTRTRQQRMAPGSHGIAQVFEGFRVSWQDKRVLGLVIVHMIPVILVIPYLPYLAVIAQEVHGRGANAYGMLTAMVGAGAVFGLFALALMRDPRRKGLLMLVCFTAYTVCLFVVAASPSFVVALVMLWCVGFVNSIAFALNNTLIQLAAPNEVRGRVMGVWQVTGHLQPLGAIPMGYAIDRFGVPLGMGTFMVVATVVFLLFTLAWGSVRKM